MKWVLAVLGGLLLLAGVATFAVIRIGEKKIDAQFEETRAAVRSDAAQHLAEFREDQKYAATIDVFSIATGNRDAGVYLNPRLMWNSDGAGGSDHELSIPPGSKEAILSWGKDWVHHAREAHALHLDASWISRLKDYDLWNLLTQSPLGALLAKTPYADPIRDPLPNFTDLVLWAKLRLLEGLRARNLAPALADTHQLAHLLYTTENYVAELATVSILGLESSAIDEARSMKIPFGNRRGLSDADVKRVRRTLYAFPALLDFLADPELARNLPGTVGLCAALPESRMGMAGVWAPLLKPELPEYYDRITDLLRRHPECRLQRYRKVWNDPELARANLAGKDVFAVAETGDTAQPAPAADTSSGTYRDAYQIARFSMARKTIVRILLSLGQPNWWKLYQ